jgi:hypothetical protein
VLCQICHLVNLPVFHFAILPTNGPIRHFINLPFCQFTTWKVCAILSTHHFVNLPFYQLAFQSIHYCSILITLYNSVFCLLDFLSACHFMNSPFGHCVISSTVISFTRKLDPLHLQGSWPNSQPLHPYPNDQILLLLFLQNCIIKGSVLFTNYSCNLRS